MNRFLLPLLICVTIAGTAAGSRAAGPPEPVIPECCGVNIHFTGDHDDAIKQIHDAGFRFVRTGEVWRKTETTKSVYDFSGLQAQMKNLQHYGMRAIILLAYGNPLYEPYSPNTKEAVAAYAAYAAAAARTFKGTGTMFEIWNEPNGASFWKPKPNADDYTRLAIAAAKAIHQADPDAVVLAPSVAGMDYAFLEQTFKDGLLDVVDAVSLHPYTKHNPEVITFYVGKLRDLMARYSTRGRTITLVVTEWGYSTPQLEGGEDQQAQYIDRVYLSSLLAGIQTIAWYDWRNDNNDPKSVQGNFGVVNTKFQPKPGYNAFQTLTRQLDGYRLLRRLPTKDQDDYVVLFRNPEGRLKLAAWTVKSPHKASLSLRVKADQLTVADIYGKTTESPVTNGVAALSLSQPVIYVTLPAEASETDVSVLDK